MSDLIKSCFYYFLATLVVLLSAKYIHLALIYLDTFFVYLNLRVAPFFNQVGLGSVIHKTFVLVLIPLILTAIPALIYYPIKRQTMPYLFQVTWSLWLILVISTIMIH